MLYKHAEYTERDLQTIERLRDFMPDKIFDAHAHLFDSRHLPVIHPVSCGESVADVETYKKAMVPMLCNPEDLRLNIIIFPDPSMKESDSPSLSLSDQFLIDQLNKHPECVGEIMVLPSESAEDIEKRLVHSGIRGLKCYHYMSFKDNSFRLSIGEYLPESAWEVASKHKLCITLHMVKDNALSDPENMEYICRMAKRYPDVVLILAHAARGFASWTAVDSISKITHLENVWYDFAAVCEAPAMFQIMKKVGVSRCMWGSDYPVCTEHGKAISVGDTFHWIYQSHLPADSDLAEKCVLIGIENLLATRQACILADLSSCQVEDLFFNNAVRLFMQK